MQTGEPTLPVVQPNVQKAYNRKLDSKSATLEPKKLSSYKSTLPPSNKKYLNPLLGEPYKSSTKQQMPSSESKSSTKSALGQRVMSAKMLRFKQLQNQLADAHYHLNELANENRILKALQKRQDSALRRYEGTNAELPRIINSHHEELRVLQTKYKRLKELHKATCNLLKEKESELYSANSQNKHLLQLSKDRNLEEREKLQLQISDTNHKIQQQQETIQLLHRKMALETKSLKRQLHIEASKHKETQKNLHEANEKLKTLECLLDNREKRQYYNGQLPIYNKQKVLGSHSLTNLRDISTNSVKVSSRIKQSENVTSQSSSKNNLPTVDTLEHEFNDDENVTRGNTINYNRSTDQLKSETMTSLQQIRKFRLQKSPHMRKNTRSMDDLRLRFKDTEALKAHEDERIALYRNASEDLKSVAERDSPNDDIAESGKLRKLFSRMKNQKLQEEMKDEFDYSSDGGESENASEHGVEFYSTDNAQKSRELYARLISSNDDTSDTLDDMMKRTNIHYNDDDDEEEDEEELNTRLVKNLTFQKRKCKNKLKTSQHQRDEDLYESDSEADFEEKKDINGDYFSTKRKIHTSQDSLSKYQREESNKSSNTTGPECEVLETKEHSVTEKFKDTELQRIPNDFLNGIHVENIEISEQPSNAKKWQEKRLLETNGVSNSSVDIKKKYYIETEGARDSENKPKYSETSYSEIYNNILKQSDACEGIKNLSSPDRKETRNDLQQMHEKAISKMGITESKETEYVLPEKLKLILDKEKLSSLSNVDNQTTHNLVKEHSRAQIEEMPSMIHHAEEALDKNSSIEINNKKLNGSLKLEDNIVSKNTHVLQQTEQNNRKAETRDAKLTNDKKKVINYNKEKLLATMKAIDDNENIEFLNEGFKNHNAVNRTQITENLYRGLPTHSRPKRDVIRDIFEDNHIENKARGACSKSH